METRTLNESRCIELEVDERAAGLARLFVKETLFAWSCSDLYDELSLAVSELVTNSIVHAKSTTCVTLVKYSDVIQLRVKDQESHLPKKRQPAFEETGGRGILLVEAVSCDWGVDAEPPGKTVWLDVSRSGR